jgi:hypothetical protein
MKKKDQLRTPKKYIKIIYYANKRIKKTFPSSRSISTNIFSYRMGDSERVETRVLSKKNSKRSSLSSVTPNPARPVRFLISRRRAAKENSSVASPPEMETSDKPTSYTPGTTYGYLEHIQYLKPALSADDKSLPKKVR